MAEGQDEVDLTGDNSPEPVRHTRRSSGAAKRPRTSGSVEVQLDDGNTAKRSLRIAKLEGEAQRKAVEAELEKEREQQMVLHGRIASLLKKVEYMDKRRSEAEEKLVAILIYFTQPAAVSLSLGSRRAIRLMQRLIDRSRQ